MGRCFFLINIPFKLVRIDNVCIFAMQRVLGAEGVLEHRPQCPFANLGYWSAEGVIEHRNPIPFVLVTKVTQMTGENKIQSFLLHRMNTNTLQLLINLNSLI